MLFAYAETKTQISFAVTAKLISDFFFAIWIVQSLYYMYLNPKFQFSSHASSVAVQPRLCGTWSENPKTGFSERGSNRGVEISDLEAREIKLSRQQKCC